MNINGINIRCEHDRNYNEPCTACDAELDKYRVIGIRPASAARIEELEAENKELSEAVNVQNSTIVDIGTKRNELLADCKAMAGVIIWAANGKLPFDLDHCKKAESACTIAAKYREEEKL